MVPSSYSVEIEEYAETHFGKKFKKKYKSAWALTLNEIKVACSHIDNMLKYNRADLINYNNNLKLVKLDFAIHGTKISPKASGNRGILFVNEEDLSVRILLLYSKNEICEPNETVKWKELIFSQYPDVADAFGT